MQAPGTTLPAYTISELDQLQTPVTQLAGALLEFEIEVSPGVYKNVRGTTEELAQYLATLYGASSTPIVLRLSATQWYLNAAARTRYNAGQLLYLYDDGTSFRTTVQASSFGVSPTNTASQNAAGMDAMRTNLLGQ
jgi:hypothetical protein